MCTIHNRGSRLVPILLRDQHDSQELRPNFWGCQRVNTAWLMFVVFEEL